LRDQRAIVFDLDDTLYPYRAFVRSGFRAVACRLVADRGIPPAAVLRVLRRALAKELLTHADLMTVLHRQGFDDLSDVERCVLEPGGTFYIKRKSPPADELAHQEVMRTLAELKALLQQQKGVA